MKDVVIVTHRDMVALAPQPRYLAEALATRGLQVALVSRAPVRDCGKFVGGRLKVVSPAQWGMHGRLGVMALFALAFLHCSRAKVVVNFDISNLYPVAAAYRFRKFVRVLYWLENIYGSFGADRPSRSTLLGLRCLDSLAPPEAVVDVSPERLEESRQLCGAPDKAFVLRNVAPLALDPSATAPKQRTGVPRLVYAGSVTGCAEPGLRLLIQGLARSGAECRLDILPAEGRAKANGIVEIIRSLGIDDRIIVADRVDRSELHQTLSGYDVGVVLYPVLPGSASNVVMAAPNKLYDYLAAGLAVLASDNATLRFVSEEGLGWNLPDTEVDSLVALLNQLSDRSEVDRCRYNAHAAYVRSYNYESQSKPLVDWIETTLRGTALQGGPAVIQS